MPHSTPRTCLGIAVALAATATLAATVPSASAADADTPRLKVLTYNAFLFSKTA
ncbi:hypothetical protein AB0I84_36635 [Streptomyces spectabilis]|uniref:hypothetical protein n=1 Tax=Streptomyces spectabilis TaxID=68270 RepID=UPI0033F69081